VTRTNARRGRTPEGRPKALVASGPERADRARYSSSYRGTEEGGEVSEV
jgi:hypothetical protein